MDLTTRMPGLGALRARTSGDPTVCVAVLDGPPDLAHPCFAGAALERLATPAGESGDGPMSVHGTHVTSLLFGHPDGPVPGIAPDCRGVLLPVFSDGGDGRASQLDLARAVERALEHGADVISVSGGQSSPTGEAEPILSRALQACADAGALVVAAVGNDGSESVQVPAAHPTVLAVGALDVAGRPLPSNNWGEAFRINGVLAPGQDIAGAVPGGGVRILTGSSFATPLVAGVAALLVSAARRLGLPARGTDAGEAILASAIPCPDPDDVACARHLRGRLDAAGALHLMIPRGAPAVEASAPDVPVVARTATAGGGEDPDLGRLLEGPGAPTASPPLPDPAVGLRAASSECGCGGTPTAPAGLIYAIGTIGYDFGTEARRDGFRQQMSRFDVREATAEEKAAEDYVPELAAPNPYDSNQLSAYLAGNPWASDKLIWTLNLDRTPIYALESEVPVGMTWEPFSSANPKKPQLDQVVGDPAALAGLLETFSAVPPVSYVYKTFRDAIVGQALRVDDDNFVSRVSVPGVLTNRTVRLFSGQVVPVVEVKARGLHTWNEAALVSAAVGSVKADMTQRGVGDGADEDVLRQNIRAFLDKVYYQFRNLGQSAPDRAMNYAGTNAFMFTEEIRTGLLSAQYVPGSNEGFYTLDTVTVSKSPYCRMDSDCWDVVVSFFDPENDRRARVSYLFTIDVSDELPVSLAPAHRFLGGR